MELDLLISQCENTNTTITVRLQELHELRASILPQLQGLQISDSATSDEIKVNYVDTLNESIQLCVDKQQEFVNTNSTKLSFMRRHSTLVKFLEKGNEVKIDRDLANPNYNFFSIMDYI